MHVFLSNLSLDGNPQIDVSFGEAKVGRHYSDYYIRLAVEPDRFADDLNVASVSALPQTLTQQDHARRRGLIVVADNCPAGDRLNSEHREDTRRSDGSNYSLRKVRACQIKAGRVRRPHC